MPNTIKMINGSISGSMAEWVKQKGNFLGVFQALRYIFSVFWQGLRRRPMGFRWSP